ncbi:hypothetical protein DERP_014927 [Dermatophagoides pteronyssinus]|uniref:Uncharacterized protein n=1 Tax=Dermatophagoides pteronyssinus TaxID=6956 RepID=A0ABQ8JWM7_DERPT|nr:hypothetical protein DERP_014927 [Dermatophagoides pteronyssinus]
MVTYLLMYHHLNYEHSSVSLEHNRMVHQQACIVADVCDLTLPPPPPPVDDEHECNLSRELTGDCDDVLLLVAGILFRLFIV